jgi:RNA polymerase sigma-70 factor (ECF subfamily)
VDGDRELLEAWRGGDDRAGRKLVERHFAAIYRFFANKLGDDVDDLVQQTFLACVEGRERIGEAGFRAYLFGVARNRLQRHFRARYGARQDDVSVAQLVDSVMTAAEQLAQRREQKLLLRALRRLPIDLQIALELAYWEGLTDREVAAILEMPVGTLKSRLRKGRMLLDEIMKELAGEGPLFESTTRGFDGWVAAVREQLVDDSEARSRVDDGSGKPSRA